MKPTSSAHEHQHHDGAPAPFAIPLAAGVLAAQGILLALAFAAVLMSASTVIVAVNAQLLRRARL